MRQIKPDMVAYLDSKLANNEVFHNAIKEFNPRLAFIQTAKICIGIKESGGNNKGFLVELIQKTVDNISASEAWCMGFVQTCLAYVEFRTGLNSPIYPSEHCLSVWNKTPETQRVKVLPLPGAIAIWQHGNTTSGHTGIVTGGIDGKMFHAIEGNTEGGLDPNGEVIREGGGIYMTKRNIGGTGNMKVVGFLKPF